MSQFIRVECSVCDTRDSYEVDGMIILGRYEGKTLYYHHHAEVGGLLNLFLGPLKVGDLVKSGKWDPEASIGEVIDKLLLERIAKEPTDGQPASG